VVYLTVMCWLHTSVSLSVCHSISETNLFVRFSWNSVLEFRTKRVSNKRAFSEKRLSASRNLIEEFNEFLTAHSIFFYVFVWTGYRNLHTIPLCKYQINQNRSGSHTVVQGVNGKNKIYFLNFPSDLNTFRYKICSQKFVVWLRFTKISSLKDIHFGGEREAHHRVVLAYLSISLIGSSTWRSSNGINGTCCGWSNHMNVLCSDVVFVWL
jgi:hypothetical protein